MLTTLVLVCYLVLALQAFFYASETPGVYLVSKFVFLGFACVVGGTWLAAVLARRGKVPIGTWCMLVLLSLAATAAVAAHFQFGQSVVGGIAAEIKLFAVMYFFLTLLLLRWLRPSLASIGRLIELLALATILLGTGIYFWGNLTALQQTLPDFVQLDNARGFRVLLPTIFVQLAAFTWYHEGSKRAKFLPLLLCVCAVWYLAFVAGERTHSVAIVTVIALGAAHRASGGRTVVRVAVATVVVVVVVAFARGFAAPAIGSSVAYRAHEGRMALGILSGRDPLKLIFGLGYPNRMLGLTVSRTMGPGFWPSDIGWLGIVVEFGMWGALVIGFVYWYMLRRSWAVSQRTDSSLVLAVRDYCLVVILMSVVVTTLPLYAGRVGTLLAILLYANEREEGRVREWLLSPAYQ